MKTIRFSLLWAGALLVPGAGPVCAEGPPGAATTGKVLVLENEHTLEGDIERVGDQYRVRRTVGETWIPADRVQCLCATRAGAYDFLRGRANLRDPDERLRLAAWCRLNGLPQQALAEVQAAVELRPGHAETRRLLTHLQQAALSAPAHGRPAVPAQPPAPEGPPIDLTADCLGLFATRVQPILMNTCASCHANGRGGAFKLTRAYEVGTANRRTVQQNLTAVLAQVNLEQPEFSRLLTKAVSDHGRVGQSPLRNRQQAAYRTLEDWVRRTAANNPHLREQAPPAVEPRHPAAPPAPAAPAGQATPPAAGPAAPVAPARAESHWGEDVRAAVTVPAGQPESRPPPQAPPAESVGPADPEEFNRQMHPEKSQPSPDRNPGG